MHAHGARVAVRGARPGVMTAQMGALARKMRKGVVESRDGRVFYIDVQTDPVSGKQTCQAYASPNWREAICCSSKLWNELALLSTVDDADPDDDQQPYGGHLADADVISITAPTTKDQAPKNWPSVDSFVRFKRDGIYTSASKEKRVRFEGEEEEEETGNSDQDEACVERSPPRAQPATIEPLMKLFAAASLPYQ